MPPPDGATPPEPTAAPTAAPTTDQPRYGEYAPVSPYGPPPQYQPFGPPPPSTPRRRALGITGLIVGIALLLGGTGLAVLGVLRFALEAINNYSQPAPPPPSEPEFADGELDVTAATDEQKIGVVTILTDLYYDDQSQAAGTGSILSSNGMVLTNNHVIEGSTYIEVTIELTGETYDAVVLGTDKTNDVALLQLEDVSGLDPVTISAGAVEIGDTAASIGNARGTGDLVVAEGIVLSIDESLSISDGYDGFENLDDLIEVDADVVSGDSGGPLVDDRGEVVGMITAASSGRNDIRGYAIAIAHAMAIVEQIRSGVETDTVHIGPSAFMGVRVADEQGATGVTLDGTIADTPADKAGLVAGDIVTAVDGVSVLTLAELKAIVTSHDPGDVITVTYTDMDGVVQNVQLTLTEGPA